MNKLQDKILKKGIALKIKKGEKLEDILVNYTKLTKTKKLKILKEMKNYD